MLYPRYKLFYIFLLLITLVVIFWLLETTGINNLIMDWELLVERVQQLGVAGPLLLIGLMILAIVFNPLPSAPIAVASGAVYGHGWGTVYIVIGALLGAILSFLISRYIAYDWVKKHMVNRVSLDRWNSQNMLMLIVFISRLLPFVSFDLMSYAAGLTPILIWRFIVATLFGLIPVSFLLAHFGDELTSANLDNAMIIIFLLGAVILLPFIVNQGLKSFRHKE